MIIGTAGHIDHGKSALVEALTGQAMDRLAEERKRGITIDLNFAPLALADGRLVGMVDVPGHEDLVRTMVAGASGMDLLLLVVAANEGIMPQTREHLAIAEQLALPLGIPVITKADLVEPDWLEMVRQEVDQWLRSSPIPFTPAIAVSAVRGDGLRELRNLIGSTSNIATPRAAEDVFRLPVDRVFSVAGIGTVVTGTAWSGALAVGDPVLVVPGGREGRVRSIESHGRSLATSEPGARTALGISGLERREVGRGDLVVASGVPWTAAMVIDVWIHLIPEATRALTSRTRVRLHHGTAELLARVSPRQPIAPGAGGLARLALEAPAVVRGGDRFVLRSYSPVSTIGGGWVVDPTPPRRRAPWSPELASLEPGPRLAALVARRHEGVSLLEIPLLVGCPPVAVQEVIHAARTLRLVGDRVVSRDSIASLAARALALVEVHHRNHPSEPGLSVETLRRALRAAPPLVEAALADQVGAGNLEVKDGSARVPGFRASVEGGSGEIDRVVGILARAGLTPPDLSELSAGSADVAATLRIAASLGRVVPVERTRYYTAEALATFTTALREIGARGEITPAALRERLGLSRKYLIPLLEWADREGITLRVGDGRKLKPPRLTP